MVMPMFHKLYKKPFDLLGCYEVLINLPKWNNYAYGLRNKKEGSAAVSNKKKAPDNSSTTSPTTNLMATDVSAVESASVSNNSSGNKTSGPPLRPTLKGLSEASNMMRRYYVFENPRLWLGWKRDYQNQTQTMQCLSSPSFKKG
jgi:hypothetical protein